MTKLNISWEEYHNKTEQLAIKVHEDGWQFNQVVCIAKGGMRVGDIFARIFLSVEYDIDFVSLGNKLFLSK